MQVFADEEVTLVWDGEKFGPQSDSAKGVRFTFATLSYWDREAMNAAASDTDKVRLVIERSLCAIDGSADKAKRFVAKPAISVVNHLFTEVWAHSMGKSVTPEADQ